MSPRKKKEGKEHPIEMSLDVLIPHEDENFFVELPKRVDEWAKDVSKCTEQGGYLRMNINNLPSGCGGTGISFYGNDKNDAFTLIVTKDTLSKMIHALQLAHEHYIE